MGFTLEFIFTYFNGYESFTRKNMIKCLERKRYEDYKNNEKIKLMQIKEQKIQKLKQLEEIALMRKNAEGNYSKSIEKEEEKNAKF
jgi:hypothetical protein